MLHQEQQGPVQVIVKTLLNERFVIPVCHEIVLGLDAERPVYLFQDLPAVLLFVVGGVVEHLEYGRVLTDLRQIHLDVVDRVHQRLDGVLESRVVQRAEAPPKEEVPELEVALRLLFVLALEYFLEAWDA